LVLTYLADAPAASNGTDDSATSAARKFRAAIPRFYGPSHFEPTQEYAIGTRICLCKLFVQVSLHVHVCARTLSFARCRYCIARCSWSSHGHLDLDQHAAVCTMSLLCRVWGVPLLRDPAERDGLPQQAPLGAVGLWCTVLRGRSVSICA